jgi:hypothetical protein
MAASFILNSTGKLKTIDVSENNTEGNPLTLQGGASTGDKVGGDIIFQTTDTGSTDGGLNNHTTKMAVKGDGKVGIGTDTPDVTTEIDLGEIADNGKKKLQITYTGTGAKSDADNGGLSGSTGFQKNCPFKIFKSDYGEYGIGTDMGHFSDTGDFYIQCEAPNTGSRNILMQSYAGRVGIRTINPTTALSVGGQVTATGGFNDTSDDRIKYNEENINGTSALSLINQLQPQKYEKIIETPNDTSGTWIPTDAEWPNVKDNYVWGLEAGLIAQDIQTISELSFTISGEEVDSSGNQRLLSINYNSINAYHIAATQALTAQLEAEKAKTATLETQMTDLLARVTALENP